MTLSILDMPSIGASSSLDPSFPDDLWLHIDTGTSPSMIHPDKLDEIWGTLSASPGFKHHHMQEPLVFRGMGGIFVARSYVRCTLRIGGGQYYVTLLVVPELPVDAIMGNGLVMGLGVRFNHTRRMLRLKLPRMWLAPGYEQPMNSKGKLMSCQWVPMHYDVRQYSLW